MMECSQGGAEGVLSEFQLYRILGLMGRSSTLSTPLGMPLLCGIVL